MEQGLLGNSFKTFWWWGHKQNFGGARIETNNNYGEWFAKEINIFEI